MNTFISAAVYVDVPPSDQTSPVLTSLAHRFEERKLSIPDSGRAAIINKRQLAYLSPRLGVLNNIPFAIPFDVRVEIFRKFVQNDIQSRGYTPWAGRMGAAKVVVRRDHIAQDGFDKLGEVDLRAPIAITFVDQWGNEECVLLEARTSLICC